MSARKAAITGSSSIQQVTVHDRQTQLSLSSDAVVFHKNGIEFRSGTPFSPWAEMTLTLQSPRDGSRVHCSGVVIACTGNRHAGYHVQMVFTGLSRQAETWLGSMTVAQAL